MVYGNTTKIYSGKMMIALISPEPIVLVVVVVVVVVIRIRTRKTSIGYQRRRLWRKPARGTTLLTTQVREPSGRRRIAQFSYLSLGL